jgi:predicted O-methyltransferase YrrM
MIDWQSVPGWLLPSHADCLRRWAEKAQPCHLVELGSYMGRSTSILADVARDNRMSVYAIDRWLDRVHMRGPGIEPYAPGSYLPAFISHMARLEVLEWIKPLTLWTTDAANLFGDESVCFIFHDASHDAESVCEDLEAWLPKLRPGGLWLHHDFGEGGGRIVEACAELELIELVDTMAVFRKRPRYAAVSFSVDGVAFAEAKAIDWKEGEHG